MLILNSFQNIFTEKRLLNIYKIKGGEGEGFNLMSLLLISVNLIKRRIKNEEP